MYNAYHIKFINELWFTKFLNVYFKKDLIVDNKPSVVVFFINK